MNLCDFSSCLVTEEEQNLVYRGDEDSAHDQRRRALCRQDIVFTLSLPQVVSQQLERIQQIHGPEVCAQLMQTVDPDVRIQLKSFMPSNTFMHVA